MRSLCRGTLALLALLVSRVTHCWLSFYALFTRFALAFAKKLGLSHRQDKYAILRLKI